MLIDELNDKITEFGQRLKGLKVSEVSTKFRELYSEINTLGESLDSADLNALNQRLINVASGAEVVSKSISTTSKSVDKLSDSLDGLHSELNFQTSDTTPITNIGTQATNSTKSVDELTTSVSELSESIQEVPPLNIPEPDTTPIDNLSESISDLNESLNDTDFDSSEVDEYAKAISNLSEEDQQLVHQIEELINSSLSDYFRRMSGDLTSSERVLSSLNEVVGANSKSFRLLANSLKSTPLGEFTDLAADLIPVIKGLTIGQESFNAVLKANPIGIVVTAISAAIRIFQTFKSTYDKLHKSSSDQSAAYDKENQYLLNLMHTESSRIGNFKDNLSDISFVTGSANYQTLELNNNLNLARQTSAQLSKSFYDSVNNLKEANDKLKELDAQIVKARYNVEHSYDELSTLTFIDTLSKLEQERRSLYDRINNDTKDAEGNVIKSLRTVAQEASTTFTRSQVAIQLAAAGAQDALSNIAVPQDLFASFAALEDKATAVASAIDKMRQNSKLLGGTSDGLAQKAIILAKNMGIQTDQFRLGDRASKVLSDRYNQLAIDAGKLKDKVEQLSKSYNLGLIDEDSYNKQIQKLQDQLNNLNDTFLGKSKPKSDSNPIKDAIDQAIKEINKLKDLDVDFSYITSEFDVLISKLRSGKISLDEFNKSVEDLSNFGKWVSDINSLSFDSKISDINSQITQLSEAFSRGLISVDAYKKSLNDYKDQLLKVTLEKEESEKTLTEKLVERTRTQQQADEDSVKSGRELAESRINQTQLTIESVTKEVDINTQLLDSVRQRQQLDEEELAVKEYNIERKITLEESYAQAFSSSNQLIESIESTGIVKSKAAKEALKAIRIGNVVAETASGSMAAWSSAMASLPYPANLIAGAAGVASTVAMGISNIAAIKSESISSASNSASGGGTSVPLQLTESTKELLQSTSDYTGATASNTEQDHYVPVLVVNDLDEVQQANSRTVQINTL